MEEVQDVSQGHKLYTSIGILMFFLVATTITRIAFRLSYFGRLTPDDYFIILGTCFNVIADGMELYAVRQGFGRHSHFIPHESLIEALKYSQLGVVMAILAICSIKISVCLFLLALVRDTHHRFRQFLWALMTFTIVTSFIALLLWGIQAHPIERLWDPRVPGTRRSSKDFLNVVYVWNAFNLVTDLIYALAPIWFLWNIQISKTEKYSIFAVMGSALSLVAIVCLCIVFAPAFLKTEDITWELVPEFIADLTQRHLGGIIANLPAIFMMLRREYVLRSSTPDRAPERRSSLFKWANITRKTEISVESQERQKKLRNPYSLSEIMTDHTTDDELPLRETSVVTTNGTTNR